MTVTPAADVAYILPTLERFRNKLLHLTTRNNLLNDELAWVPIPVGPEADLDDA